MNLSTRQRQEAARRFEEDLAEWIAGRRVFLSGAGVEKADVRRRTRYELRGGMPVQTSTLAFRIEAKTTRNDFYAFRAIDWQDLTRNADQVLEIPLFAVRFLLPSGHREVVLMRQGFATELDAHPWARAEAQMDKSRILRAPYSDYDVNYRIVLSGTKEVLFVMAMDDFLEKLHAHPDFRPSAQHPNAP